MNYSDNPRSVRVDFFKESGKWYATQAIEWLQFDGGLIHNIFEASLRKALTSEETLPPGRLRYSGMWAVCLDPYHEHSHPIMMRVPE